MHVAVTGRPTAAWTAQQLREALGLSAPISNHAFDGFGSTAKAMGIHQVLTARAAPWQNAYVERFIGSVRRECLDHVLVLSERGLRRVLQAYGRYYQHSRTHLALAKDAPIPRPINGDGAVIAMPEVGGLHHRYERRAA